MNEGTFEGTKLDVWVQEKDLDPIALRSRTISHQLFNFQSVLLQLVVERTPLRDYPHGAFQFWFLRHRIIT